MDDHELLREYVQNRSQESFRELVDRHLPMVFSAARRMIGDPHLAEEVAQSVFTTLAQKASVIASPQVVGGWLYNTTRHLAMHAVRTEQRRREREQAAAATPSTDSDTDRITEHLEPAMAELEASDRDLLVLRYLENRSLRQVGDELGISEDAARMRVNRALERLRTVLGREGIGVTSVLVATTLSSSTATAVPAGLGAAISATALAGIAAATTTATHTAITTVNWFNAKTFAAIAGAAVLTGTGTYLVQQRQIGRLGHEQQGLIAQCEKLSADRDASLAATRARDDELERLRKEVSELARLRNEVAQLRRERDATTQPPSRQRAQAPRAALTAINSVGAYVSREQLAFAGYATPEAALQSMTWAMMNGSYDQVNEGLSPELLAEELKDPSAREQFEKDQKRMGPLLKGMQFVAKKVLADDKVELKVKMDIEPLPDNPHEMPHFMIQPMVKVGNEWKLGGSTRGYEADWEKDGQIQTLTP